MHSPRSLIRFASVCVFVLAATACHTATHVPAKTKSNGAGPYRCTRVMGVAIVHEWYDHGFETYVDDARWEVQAKRGQYLERWRDPKDEVWNEPIVSACAQDSDNPDRILFQAVNWSYTNAEQWTADLMKIIPQLKERFSNLRRIELITLTRPPGNVLCPNTEAKSMVQPFVDEAVARVAAEFPELITVGAPIYTPGCEVYNKGSAHWTPEAFPTMARIYGQHYAQDQ
jgi:hypothetical protein